VALAESVGGVTHVAHSIEGVITLALEYVAHCVHVLIFKGFNA